MKHRTTRVEGFWKPEPEKLKPKGDIKPPLFPEKIDTLENILDAKTRDKVGSVVLLRNLMVDGLGWPLMGSRILAQILPLNFPEAEFTDFTGFMGLIKMPYGQKLTVREDTAMNVIGEGHERNRTLGFIEGSVPANTQYNDIHAISEATLELVNFGNQYLGDVSLLRKGHERVRQEFGGNYTSVHEIMDRQVRVLRKLGFDELPQEGEHLLLTPDKFSDRLNVTIHELEGKIKKEGCDMPLVFVNASKRVPSDFTGHEGFQRELVKFLDGVDAAVVVNRGSDLDASNIHTVGDELHQSLSDKYGDRVLDLGRFGLTKLAALMHIADKTGGCLIDVFCGTTILADWLGVREAAIEIPKYSFLIRERDNLAVVKEDSLGEIPNKVKQLMGV